MSKVEVKPIDKQKWHNKKGKESFTLPKVLEVLVDGETQKYATGLTKEEAKEYGDRMGVDLSDNYSRTNLHSYWPTKAAQIKLPNHLISFDTSKDSDYIKVKNMKASKQVANSLAEYENGEWPHATHVIWDETEEVEQKASRIEQKRLAIEISSKMNLSAKINLIAVIDNKNLKGMSESFVTVAMDEIIESPAKIKDFHRYVAMGPEDVNIRGTIARALMMNVLTREGVAIMYMGNRLANSEDDLVNWFKDENNSVQKIAIMDRLNQ